MIEMLKAVFVEGCVFKDLLDPPSTSLWRSATCTVPSSAEEPLPRIHSAVSVGGTEAGFITAKVMRNLRRKYVFYAGGMPVLLWGDPQSAHKKELLHRFQNVAKLTIERLRADFPRTDVRSALAVFDRRLVMKGFGPLPDSDVRRFLLRGARQLANLLGCEENAVVLQYQSVLQYMIMQMAPGQPLAEKSNQQAWALLLDDEFWEAACPNRLRAASRALAQLIRFYISIEDGECTVERDLAEFREKIKEHRTSDMDFLDDSLLMRLNGPRTLAEFDEGTADSRVELTPFSRECASLWRELFGTRFGHYNAKATAAAKLKKRTAPGTFRGAVLGVLAAARLAVARARHKAQQPRISENVVHSGAGTTESVLWNESMSNFQQRSRNNIPGVHQTRAGAGGPFMKPAGVNLTANRGAKEQPLALNFPYIPKVAIVGADEMGVCLAKECTFLTGLHRCAEADLVVVSDLSILHDVDALAVTVDLVVSLLYIVSFGLKTTTKTQLAAVQGSPRRLSPQHCVRHVPAHIQKVTFCVGPRLSVEQEGVRQALERIARAPASNFILSKKSEPAAGSIFSTISAMLPRGLALSAGCTMREDRRHSS